MLGYDDFIVGQLREDGRIDDASVDAALKIAVKRQISVLDALVEDGHVPPREMAIVRATVCEVPFVDLDQFDVSYANSALLPRTTAEKHRAFPLFVLGDLVTVGMADPLDLRAVDRLRSQLKKDIAPVLCDSTELSNLIDRAYSLSGSHQSAESHASVSVTDDDFDEEPIVAAVNQMITQAIEQGASDIHISPDERELHLRYRIDGSLQVRQGPPLSSHAGLVQRIKVMAGLDLTQTRRPQDGKFRFTAGKRAVDVRVSVIPTVSGENAVLRLLATSASLKGFNELGFNPRCVEQFERLIERPYGMILVTGPTGSGKTTTLYTALNQLNTPDRNIMTIEDPVEIRLPMIRQIQANAEIGLTFAGALRSILRQDPDVILLGEICDEETARIALQAALTGHLVFSTLHTNDAPGAVARLTDFGCPPFAINAALLSVIAMRLVKRVCDDCSRPCEPRELLVESFGLGEGEASFRAGAGCARCMNTGYRGRLAVMEMMVVTPEIQKCIERCESSVAIRRLAIEQGMEPMWADGVSKAQLGMTTLDEVARLAAGSLESDRVAMSHVAKSAMRMSA